MASGHQDRVREPLRGRPTPARRVVTNRFGSPLPTARQPQGTERRPGDSPDRGQGGWFRKR